MIDANETFDGTFPFKPHFSSAAGFQMHYVDEGCGAPVVCLHGQPTWSYLYRDIIRRLMPCHRVIAPDLMGFGKSETPTDREYSFQSHVDSIVALVEELDLQSVTLVVHDWGGYIGAAAAVRLGARIVRLVAINTNIWTGSASDIAASLRNFPESRYFTWMSRLYEAGTLEIVLGEIGTLITSVMKDLQGVQSNTDPTWVRAYATPFATPAEALGAIAFPRSVVTGTTGLQVLGAKECAQLQSLPAMMIYGMRDRVLLAHHMIPAFEATFPQAPVHRLETAGHFAQEDAPETIAVLIDQFVRQTFRGAALC